MSSRPDPARADAPVTASAPALDRLECDIIEIVKRVSRRPIMPTLDDELMEDLGFDSLQVLELVGELEDHFNIAMPLNLLIHIRTVGQITEEVRRLTADQVSRG